MTEIVYKKECFEIVGCCFDVFNAIGPGLRESTYQKAVEESLRLKKLDFESQLHVPIKIGDKTIAHYYLDLLVKEKIAVELKVGDHFHQRDIAQLMSYLKSKNLLLGILINFSSRGVVYKRIPNLRD